MPRPRVETSARVREITKLAALVRPWHGGMWTVPASSAPGGLWVVAYVDGRQRYECTCPAGQKGAARGDCKHVAAVSEHIRQNIASTGTGA